MTTSNSECSPPWYSARSCNTQTAFLHRTADTSRINTLIVSKNASSLLALNILKYNKFPASVHDTWGSLYLSKYVSALPSTVQKCQDREENYCTSCLPHACAPHPCPFHSHICLLNSLRLLCNSSSSLTYVKALQMQYWYTVSSHPWTWLCPPTNRIHLKSLTDLAIKCSA